MNSFGNFFHLPNLFGEFGERSFFLECGTIKFTSEYENDIGHLNFLDTTLTRNIEHKKIEVRWFRKPTASETASDRFLNYDSCHQQTVKKNIVKSIRDNKR